MISREFQNAVHRKLLTWGWSVQRDTGSRKGWESARAYWDPPCLRRHGFQPRTIIDVGLGEGTPQRYEAFPAAYLVLVEPLEEFAAGIATTLARRPGVHALETVGCAEERRTVRVEPRWTERSSFFARHGLERTGDVQVMREVPVTTLDRLMSQQSCPAPFGLKIDREGVELEVIRGAAATLQRCVFVIAEVSVLARFEGSHTFAQFIAAMDQAGFDACDILHLGRADSSDVAFTNLLFRQRSNAA